MSAGLWEGLNPPYSTIVADPPWHYASTPPSRNPLIDGHGYKRSAPPDAPVTFLDHSPFPYSTMSSEEIAALPVGELAAGDAHCYLWTTNRYLPDSFTILAGWGFRYAHTLVWAKPPKGLVGGGAFTITTEFVLFGRRGVVPQQDRTDSTWWQWARRSHSEKPAAFFDVVERVSPGPYVELFARAPRLGWDSWGRGYESERAS